MATYVLVHGGGHGGWCYERVARILQAKGHVVYAPTMTGLGERAHLLNAEVDLHRHIEDIAAVLQSRTSATSFWSGTATAGWSSPAPPTGSLTASDAWSSSMPPIPSTGSHSPTWPVPSSTPSGLR